jgi:hypothetical protein
MRAPFITSREQPTWKAAGRGLFAGLVGTAAMTAFQTQVAPRLPIPEGPKLADKEPNYPPEPHARKLPATDLTAERLSKGFAKRPLTGERLHQAGNLIHFAFGSGWGLAWALARRAPLRAGKPTFVRGLLFGTAVWMIADNVLLPIMRIGSWPNRYGAGVHAKALLAHLVYGAATGAALGALEPRRRGKRATGRIKRWGRARASMLPGRHKRLAARGGIAIGGRLATRL